MSDNKIAVPLTERQMSATHAAILREIDSLVEILATANTQEQIDNLRIQIGEQTLTAVMFRQMWRNSITADE